METKTFRFRRRTGRTSYDSYDGLTTTCDSFPPVKLEDEYWTNGSTVLLSTNRMQPSSPSIATSIALNNPNYSSPITNTKMESLKVPAFASVDNCSSTVKRNKIGTPVKNVRREGNEVRNSIIAGSIAGMTSCAIFHPFDVVRTKMQASTSLTTNVAVASKGKSLTNTNTLNPTVTSSSGPIAVMSHTYKNGGVRAFYTGISLPLAAQAVYKSTVFTTNRIATNLLTEWKTQQRWKTGIFTPYKLTLTDHFICGSLSGAANALLFVCPVEFVRNQLIQQHTKRAQGVLAKDRMLSGPIDVIKTTMKTDGFLGLWRGAGVTLMRDSLGCGAYFMMNDIGQKNISYYAGYKKGTWTNTIGSGFIAGFGYWFVSLPLDALKTLVQTGKSQNATETFSFLVKRDGTFGAVKSLYRGWQVAFGRGSPSAAVTLTTYSVVYNFCEKAIS